MSGLFGNHIVGFPTRRLKFAFFQIQLLLSTPGAMKNLISTPASVSKDSFKHIHVSNSADYLSRDARKPVFGVSDKA